MNKRKWKFLILILSIIFLLFFIAFPIGDDSDVFLNIIVSEEGKVEIEISEQKKTFAQFLEVQGDVNETMRVFLQEAWYEDGKYFFLPDYLDLSDVNVTWNDVSNDTNQVSLDGVLLQKDVINKIKGLKEGTHYITIDNDDISFDVMKGSSLPSVWIDLQDGLEFIQKDKENSTSGDMKIISADGNIEYIGKLESLSGRGNSSWSQLKKNYGIKLVDADYLLGMSPGKSWILQGGVMDSTSLRNKIFLDMGIGCGLDNGVESEWIDLYIDKKYCGCYLLSEKITIAKGRLEIGDLEKETELINDESLDLYERFQMNGSIEKKGYLVPNNPDDITGGYLLEVEMYVERYNAEESGFITTNGVYVVIKNPKYCSSEQVEYISSYVKQFEEALYAESGYNLEGNYYLEYIDLESFVIRYLIDEISKNIDAGFSSYFFYKPSGDLKMYAGPVWDYDTALGNNNGWGDANVLQNPEGMYANQANWSAKLYQKPEFASLAAELYQDYFQTYLEELNENGLQDYRDTIYESVEMESIYYGRDRTEEEIDFLIDFLQRRKTYLDEIFIDEEFK